MELQQLLHHLKNGTYSHATKVSEDGFIMEASMSPPNKYMIRAAEAIVAMDQQIQGLIDKNNSLELERLALIAENDELRAKITTDRATGPVSVPT
jgi:hypothetical protein